MSVGGERKRRREKICFKRRTKDEESQFERLVRPPVDKPGDVARAPIGSSAYPSLRSSKNRKIWAATKAQLKDEDSDRAAFFE